VLEKDAVLERLMPALDLALGLRVTRDAADMLHLLAIQPLREIRRDVRRAVVRQQARPVNDSRLIKPNPGAATTFVPNPDYIHMTGVPASRPRCISLHLYGRTWTRFMFTTSSAEHGE
jgi:hypothetical protein